MALTTSQVAGLNALNKKIATGYTPTATDTANLDFAKKQGYAYNPLPQGATKIASPTELKGLNETQLYREGASIYKLPETLSTGNMSTNTTGIKTAEPTGNSDITSMMAGIKTTDEGTKAILESNEKALESQPEKTVLDQKIASESENIYKNRTQAVKNAWETYGGEKNIKGLQNASIMRATREAEINNLIQESKNLPLVGRISGGTQDRLLRQKATEVAGYAAIEQAYQGNIELANNTAKNGIDALYKPQEDYIANLKSQLDSVEKDLTREEKKKADALNIVLDERKRLIEEEKEVKNSINQVAISAAQNGADMTTVQKILKSKTEGEAITIGTEGGFLKDLSKVPNVQVIGQDEMGNNIYGYFDPKTGKFITINQSSNETYTQDATADDIANAIKQVESGGNYNAKGGSGENGAYQFMPSTWASWSKEYASEVLKQSVGNMKMTPENQDAVAKFKIQQWLDQGLNAEQIAAKWNSGSEVGWENKIGTNSKGVAYNVPAYVNKVTGALKNVMAKNVSQMPEQGGDNINTIKQQLLASKGLTKQQRGDLLKLIDSQGVEGLKNWAYYNRLSAAQQEVFGQYENAVSAWGSALQQIDEAKTGTGPYKNLKEKAKPWLAIKRDKDYVDLMGIIEMGQAQLRKGFFGTALTSTEAGSANKFLITDNDGIDTIKWKLEQGMNFLEFANDAQIALSLGLPKPKLEDYLSQTNTTSSQDNSLSNYLNGLSGIK